MAGSIACRCLCEALPRVAMNPKGARPRRVLRRGASLQAATKAAGGVGGRPCGARWKRLTTACVIVGFIRATGPSVHDRRRRPSVRRGGGPSPPGGWPGPVGRRFDPALVADPVDEAAPVADGGAAVGEPDAPRPPSCRRPRRGGRRRTWGSGRSPRTGKAPLPRPDPRRGRRGRSRSGGARGASSARPSPPADAAPLEQAGARQGGSSAGPSPAGRASRRRAATGHGGERRCRPPPPASSGARPSAPSSGQAAPMIRKGAGPRPRRAGAASRPLESAAFKPVQAVRPGEPRDPSPRSPHRRPKGARGRGAAVQTLPCRPWPMRVLPSGCRNLPPRQGTRAPRRHGAGRRSAASRTTVRRRG